jgi:hypothetical protein
LLETIAIVGLVVFLFMGSLRTAIVPLIAMPVSLVGATILMYLLGFSLNLLTLLAIVLSVGLVVDDAIVVVENVQRHIREGMTKIDAALLGARERTDRFPRWSDGDAIQGIRVHSGSGRFALRLGGRNALADHERSDALGQR